MTPQPCLQRRRYLSVLPAAFLTGTCALPGLAQTSRPPTYSLSIVPQFSASVTAQNWSPLVDELARAGIALQLRFHKSIPDFENDFLAGLSDFIFANPYHAVMAHQGHGYIPLVKNTQEQLQGILVVRSDSTLRNIKELDGQAIAFPAPNAFGASLYMRALLADAQVRIRPSYVGNHANAYRRVLAGEFAAAGGIAATLADENDAVRRQLRVLYETPPTAPHPLMVHPRVPEATRERLRQLLVKLGGEPNGARLLDNTQLGRPGPADYKRDYAPLDRLGLQRFVVTQP
jgi:phosphonate transport system substrate-binding protein